MSFQSKGEFAQEKTILCNECHRMIVLSIEGPGNFKGKCPKCKVECEYNLSKFLKSKVPKGRSLKEVKGEKYEFYCENCEEVFSRGSKDHKNCKSIISLTGKLPSKGEFSEKIIGAKNFIENSYQTLKTICKNNISKEQERMNKIFEANKAANKKIIEFTEILLNNYSEKNLISIINLIKNTKFNLKEINQNLKNEDIFKLVESNYILGPYKDLKVTAAEEKPLELKKTISNINQQISSICLFKKNKLALGTYDKEIRIFDMEKSSWDLIIKDAHEGPIFYLTVLNSGRLISCSEDKTITLWDIEGTSYGKLSSSKEHQEGVTKIIPIDDPSFASCSIDQTIKIWDHNFMPIRDLNGHKGWVVSMILLSDHQRLMSGSPNSEVGDGTVRIWKLEEENFQKVISNVDCCNVNSLVQINGRTVLVGGRQKIYVIDVDKEELTKTFPYQKSVTCLFSFTEDTAFFGNQYGDIESLNITNGSIATLEKPHSAAINEIILLSNTTICTCSEDQTVKFFEVKRINKENVPLK